VGRFRLATGGAVDGPGVIRPDCIKTTPTGHQPRPADADTSRIGGVMATRIRQQQQRRNRGRDDAEAREQSSRRSARHADEVRHDLDDLLDEIDAVLEENAEEFVTSYVQKGGQ
jgi:prokaryotic ubiquitin-like protein Pup